MKKILLSIFAVAALFSCSKSDITYDDQPQEIALAPFTIKNTKAAVEDNIYPTGLNMYVFANIQDVGTDGSLLNTWKSPYFKNALFVHKGDAIFSGETPYHWPNVRSLKFTGLTASGNVNNDAEPTVNNETMAISLSGYEPGIGTQTAGDNDLMWFSVTEAYSKETGSSDTKNYKGETVDGHFDVTMKHACSWITINIKGDATTGVTNTTWKITDLTLKNVALSGDVVLGSEAEWSNCSDYEDLQAYTGENALTTANVDYTKITIKDLILVPQETKTLTLTYKYVSQKGAADDGSEDIVITEVKDIPLTYNGTNPWLPGVHYTYNITIGTSEILIEPTVLEWTEQTDVEIDDLN